MGLKIVIYEKSVKFGAPLDVALGSQPGLKPSLIIYFHCIYITYYLDK